MLEKIKEDGELDDRQRMENTFRYLADQALTDPESLNSQKIMLLPWQGVDLQNKRLGAESLVKTYVLALSEVRRLPV